MANGILPLVICHGLGAINTVWLSKFGRNKWPSENAASTLLRLIALGTTG